MTILGCNNNPVTPSNGNPPLTNDSLLFSKDSIVIYLNQYSLTEIYDGTSTILDSSINKIKVTFIGETNFDSSKGIQAICAFPYTQYNYYYMLGNNAINKTHEFTFETTNYSLRTWYFYTRIYESYDSTTKFLKIRNLKIYKID